VAVTAVNRFSTALAFAAATAAAGVVLSIDGAFWRDTRHTSEPWSYIVLVMLVSAVGGAAQGTVLWRHVSALLAPARAVNPAAVRRELRQTLWWPVATIVGGLAVLAFILTCGSFTKPALPLAALSTGIGQWMVLRHRVRLAWTWPVGMVISLYIAACLSVGLAMFVGPGGFGYNLLDIVCGPIIGFFHWGMLQGLHLVALKPAWPADINEALRLAMAETRDGSTTSD
jgi:hypothetical protein